MATVVPACAYEIASETVNNVNGLDHAEVFHQKVKRYQRIPSPLKVRMALFPKPCVPRCDSGDVSWENVDESNPVVKNNSQLSQLSCDIPATFRQSSTEKSCMLGGSMNTNASNWTSVTEVSLPGWKMLQEQWQSEATKSAKTTIEDEVGDALRVCLLGGKFRKDSNDEERLVPVLRAISQAFEKRPTLEVHIVTSGLEGVQRTFSHEIGENYKPKLLHLKSKDLSDTSISTGKYVEVCENKNQKAEIMANIGSVYILVSGGPGVAKEAKQALDRGAIVLPFVFTGGASAFEYADFPEMDKPKYANRKQWKALKQGPPEKAAEAAVEIVAAMVSKNMHRTPGGSKSNSSRFWQAGAKLLKLGRF